MGMITEQTISARRSIPFSMKPHPDGASCRLIPYPGWRFVPDGAGGWLHEKIPPPWERIKIFLSNLWRGL